VLHGRHEEGLQSLARLRLRTPAEAETDPLLKVMIYHVIDTAVLINVCAICAG
jgi:hypothetical protein